MDMPTVRAGHELPGHVPAGAGGDPARRAFDVADAIGEFAAILGARTPDVALVCLLSSAPLRVRGDRQRCVLALLELARPATERTDLVELRIAAAVAGEHVEIEVAGTARSGTAGACEVRSLHLLREVADDADSLA